MSRSRVLVFLVTLMTLALLTAPMRGIRAQEASPEATPAPRFTNTVEVDGRRIGLSCFGTGSPTVVLVGGLRAPSEDVWPPIVDAASPITRVCAFDRAGIGLSDPVPTSPQTPADVVADLHAALEAAGEAGPYVLVGFSLGGPFVRLHASTHPDEVAGLVLVEPVPLGRGFVTRDIEILEEVAPQEVEAERLILEGRDPSLAAPIDYVAGEEQLNAAPAPPAVPVIVLLRGALEPDPIPELETLWQEANRAQAQELGARIVIAEQSGHFVPIDEPELVIAAIEDVVEAVRDPSSWATPAASTPTA